MHPRCCQPVAWKQRNSASRLPAGGCIIPQAVNTVYCSLKMGEIVARNTLNWLELLINCYCCIKLVVYIINIAHFCSNFAIRVAMISKFLMLAFKCIMFAACLFHKLNQLLNYYSPTAADCIPSEPTLSDWPVSHCHTGHTCKKCVRARCRLSLMNIYFISDYCIQPHAIFVPSLVRWATYGAYAVERKVSRILMYQM
jgi:hypothetical protein